MQYKNRGLFRNSFVKKEKENSGGLMVSKMDAVSVEVHPVMPREKSGSSR